MMKISQKIATELNVANSLYQDPSQSPEILALDFIDAEKGVADLKAALDGAKARCDGVDFKGSSCSK